MKNSIINKVILDKLRLVNRLVNNLFGRNPSKFVKGYFFYQVLKIGSENGILVFDKNFSYLQIKFRFSKGFDPHLIKRLIRDNICQSLLHYS